MSFNMMIIFNFVLLLNMKLICKVTFLLIPSYEMKVFREESPNNMATLCYKAVEKLTHISEAFSLNPKDKEIGIFYLI